MESAATVRKFRTVKHSAGYLEDLAYLLLAHGLIVAELEQWQDDNIINRGANYQLNKRINRRLQKIDDEIMRLVRMLTPEDAKRCKKKSHDVWKKFARHTQQGEFQLASLAMYIIVERFCEIRDKPLHSDFAYFTNAERFFQALDMIGKMVGDHNYTDAYKIVRE